MAATANTEQKTAGKIGLADFVSGFLYVLLISLYLWLPEQLLFQRYLHNIFILRSEYRHPFSSNTLIPLVMVLALRFDKPGGISITAMVAGIGVAATVVNLFCNGFIDAFYLNYAFLNALIGLIAGWVFRWQTLANVMTNIFDPKVDWANHLLRLILFLGFAGIFAFVGFMAARSYIETGSWHRLFNPAWTGQPYVACLLWGWLCSYFTRLSSLLSTRRYVPPNSRLTILK